MHAGSATRIFILYPSSVPLTIFSFTQHALISSIIISIHFFFGLLLFRFSSTHISNISSRHYPVNIFFLNTFEPVSHFPDYVCYTWIRFTYLFLNLFNPVTTLHINLTILICATFIFYFIFLIRCPTLGSIQRRWPDNSFVKLPFYF